MAQIFGYPIDLPEGWRDESVYTFVLDAAEQGGDVQPAPAQVLLGRGGGSPAQQFRPNLVITRSPAGKSSLGDIVASQQKAIGQKLPEARLIEQGKTEAAGVAAHHCQYSFRLGNSLPIVRQWHFFLVRDGFAYTLCFTSEEKHFQRDKPRFEALLKSWR